MDLLTASIRNDHCLGPKLDSLLLLSYDYVAIVLVFLDHKLCLDRRDKNFSADQQLNSGHLVAWIKHLSFHYGRNIMQNMIARIVHEHANH